MNDRLNGHNAICMTWQNGCARSGCTSALPIPSACACGRSLLFSDRSRGEGMCGPCYRGQSFRTIAMVDRVNHDGGDEDRE